MKTESKFSKNKWLFWMSLAIILLPILSLILSNLLSNLLNCSSGYAGGDSCKIGDTTMGQLVYTMFTFGWVAFYTIPLGVLGLVSSGIIRLVKNKK